MSFLQEMTYLAPMKTKQKHLLLGTVIGTILFLIIQYMTPLSKQKPPPPPDATRPQVARWEKLDWANALLQNKDVNSNEFNVFIRAFKQEEILEIWAKSRTNTSFTKLIEYPFCANSGTLGPKRKEGDRQIPEGFYHVNVFNPKSNFHLSLGINYPNKADLKHADPQQPGSDIYIHGGCQTVGCIPLTNDKIKEVYLLAELAKQSGQERIPVHIFPVKMTVKNLEKISAKYPQHNAFWQELQVGYLYFENGNQLPKMDIDENGKYIF